MNDRLYLPSFAQLEEVNTLRDGEGWNSELKVDTDDFRLWISRSSVADGEPFSHTVYVEVFNYAHARWEDLGHYDGDDPPHSLPGVTPHAFKGEL